MKKHLFVALVAVVSVAGSHTDVAPPGVRSRTVGSAAAKAHPIEARAVRDAAVRVIQAHDSEYSGPTATIDDPYPWSRRLLEAERALASTKSEDISAVLDHWKRMQHYYGMISALHETGTKGGEDTAFAAAEYYLAEAELWLADAGGGVPKSVTTTDEQPTADWPQFRGPNNSGLASGEYSLPTEIGPDTNIAWKIELAPGHSSPIVFGDRLYLTAVRDSELLTIALNRHTGEAVWEAAAPHETLEAIHRIGSHAQSTPATDGEHIVSFFGSSGLVCFDAAGHQLWIHRMGPFKNDFGAGSSPILVEDRVILCQDHDTDSFLAAYDKHSGTLLWKTERSDFARNYCTPVIWEVAGRKQIVVAATLRVVGYDFETGQPLWTVRGVSRTVCMSPVVGTDGILYVAGWSAGGDAEDRIQVESFSEAAASYDKDHDGALTEQELPDGAIRQRFPQVDRDKNGGISREEYDYFRNLFDESRNVVMAIRPGGSGDITDSHVDWQSTRHVPFCASPLFDRGRIFTVKDGGIFCSIDAATGNIIKTARLHGTKNYYASPVGGDGKLYLLDEEGGLSVVSSEGRWQLLSSADFGENTYATPAIVGGRIYLRTVGHLYCFECFE
jgi:outer membrane protein assembly factor BamB